MTREMIYKDEVLDVVAATAADTIAAIAALPVVVPTVKPLVWEEQAGKSYRQANCVLGQYQISWLVEFECWQLSRPPKQGQPWKDGFSRHSHKDEAKAAAQRDYEARILAALDLTPAPVQPDPAAIREAALRLVQLYDSAMDDLLGEDVHRTHPDSDEMAEIRRALGAPALIQKEPTDDR